MTESDAPSPHREVEETASAAIDRVAHDVWEDGLNESPESATWQGDGRGDDRLSENDAAARTRRNRTAGAFLDRLDAIDPADADAEAAITHEVLRFRLTLTREAHERRDWEWNLDPVMGVHIALQRLIGAQPLGDETAWERLMARLGHVPRVLAERTEDLRVGVRTRRVPARLAVHRVIAQLESFGAARAEDTAFVKVPMSRMPADWSPETSRRWTQRLEARVREDVVPAYARYLAALRDEVLPSAREEVGLWAVPGGEQAYRERARAMTTTDLTPDEIHAIGLEELERNRAEMLEIARAEGLTGDLRTVFDTLRADDRFRLDTREEILERYRAICGRMDEALPRMFGRLPDTGYEIRPIEAYQEKDAPAAFYQPPADDGSRPGIFYANTHDPSSWPTIDFEPLCYHEAVPGHHLQIALAREMTDLPASRRHTFIPAYGEGWAHYSEVLADEMGLYSTPYDRLGMLGAQAWRAVRLVVDTGLHHLRWTREQALEAMHAVRTGPASDAENEVDRYIVWPGQALAYKVGSRTVLGIRQACRERLGSRFDLKAFHDEFLGHGALPLAVLERVMSRWTPDVA